MASNVFFYMIFALEASNPSFFYLFLGILAAGVATLFFERIEYGLISMFIISFILYQSDIYQIYTLAASISAVVILVLWVFRSWGMIRRIDNLISGLYLYLRARKHNK
ncbi:MAG: hypothetical protein QXJ12_01700 [Candidatus Parvarchaeota archaeon]|nr:hypothetical protein [Candidatus Parvarchaeota archaeon]